MVIILKNNLWSFKCKCVFFIKTHGKTNKLQITTGPSGNMLSICPLRFRIASPRVSIDLGCALVNRNSWGGGDPESFGANRSAYFRRDQPLFCLLLNMVLRYLLQRKGYVTANKKLTLFSQIHSSKSRNLWTILDWTSQIPLNDVFFGEKPPRIIKTL